MMRCLAEIYDAIIKLYNVAWCIERTAFLGSDERLSVEARCSFKVRDIATLRFQADCLLDERGFLHSVS